jgi:hypothetical protein
MNSLKLIHHEQNRKDIVSFFCSLPHTLLSRTMIFMRLPVPHFGTTSPINDHPCLSPCRRQLLAVLSTSLRPTTIVRRIAHDGVLAVSTRSLRRPMIARRLADVDVLALFTRSLRRPTIARPEALVGSPPRGKRSFRSSTSL